MGRPLIAQTLHGHGNAICWVTQAGARHEDASWVPPQPRPCPAASCARKICHIALAVAELPLKLGLVCSSAGSVRAKAGAVSPIATTGVMAECGRGEILSVGADAQCSLQVLWEERECSFARGWRLDADGQRKPVLAVLPTAEHPTPSNLDRLAHEFGLKDQLDGAWAVRPLELLRNSQGTMLLLEDPGGEPLARRLGAPMEVGQFLRLAIGIVTALGKVHQRGLVHKDLKPANILVTGVGGEVRLTGFGLASRLPRERPSLGAAGRTRRNSRLHVARTNRPYEPVDRLPKRPQRTRRHLIPDADRRAAVCGSRSDGVGALPRLALLSIPPA